MDETNNQNSSGENTNNNMHNDPVKDFASGAQNNDMVMGVLSYLGPLVLVPYLMNKNSDFVKFHTKQGMVLFGLEVVIMIVSNMMYLWMLGSLLNLATLVLTIMGIVNVVQGHKKELPVIGSLASNFKF
jgi:uncharacterized membrane protein